MDNKKLKIYLADLIHDRHLYNYSVPLNVGYITATLKQRLGSTIDAKIFKFPDHLIHEMKSSPPDVLALSNYDWNVNLNKALIKIAREINPGLFVIIGGPNIRKKHDGIKEYLLNHPSDLYVLNEGEDAFSTIIEYILGFWPCDIKKTILSSGKIFSNAAYLESETNKLIIGGKPDSAHAKDIPFPSPWLTGLLDPFINNSSFPLQPLIETNRNCPYQCHFCVWGDFELNKIRLFDYDVVIEELRYIFKKSNQRFQFMIADANFGILNRDVKIAEELRNLSDKYKNVDRVWIAQAKNSVGRNLEIAKILKKVCVPEFAVQTLTPGVLEYSGRKNLDNKAISQYVAGVKSHGHEVFTDIMLGLPGETKEDFYNSMTKVIDFGFQRAAIADIRLLAGSEMAEDDYRKKFGIESLYRVIPSAYGEYGGIKVVEYEECIRKNSTMSSEDFSELRLFNANYFVLYYVELARPLLDFAQKNGIHPIKLISNISKEVNKEKYPILSDYLDKFNKQASSEWYKSAEEADKHYLKTEIFNKLMKDGFPKLSYEYAAQLISNKNLRNEFLQWIAENIRNELPGKDLVVDELVKFCVQRIYDSPFSNKKDTMELSFDTSNHLALYLNDYNYDTSDSQKEKKGEYRDLVGSTKNTYIKEPFNLENKEVSNGDSFSQKSNKNFKIKLKFDTDEEKSKWLQKEVERNGGSKDLQLAIQVVLTNNQKAFLRSYSLNK